MKKRIFSFFLAAVLIVSLLPASAFAAAYEDTRDHWAESSIERWSSYSIVNGKGDGVFDPNGQMTRAEAAQVFAKLFGLHKEGDISSFKDVGDAWYTSAIAKCFAAGILNGKGDGVMDPSGTITREEFFSMFTRAVGLSDRGAAAEARDLLTQKGFTDTAKVSDWAADAIGTLVEKGYVHGVSATEIAPQANINRASVMALLDKAVSTYVGQSSTEATVSAESWGITLIANPDVTAITGTADMVIVAAGAEQRDGNAGEIMIDASAKIGTLIISAGDMRINVAGKVDMIENRAEKTEITGSGDVGAVRSVEDVTVNTADTKVENANEEKRITVTDGKGKTTAVAVGSSVTIANKQKAFDVVDAPYTPSYSDLTVTEAGIVTGGTYNDVTITSDVGDGDVTLENVTIKGKLIVEGGGSNSIHLDGCKVDTIQVNKDTTGSAETPRIELNNTPVQTIEAVKPVIIEADTASTVKTVEAKSDVTVQGENTTVQNVTAAADNVKLTVEGAAVENVTAEKPVTIEATSEKSTIKAVEAKSNVTVQGAATKVDKVTVPESEEGTGVELKIEGAKVSEVKAEDPVTINATAGASPIEKVEAKDNVTVQGAQIETVTVPENVVTKPEITVTTGTVSTVEAKSEIKVEGGNNTIANVKAEAPVVVNSATVVTVTVTVQVTVTVTGTSNVEVAVAAPVSVNIAADNGNSVAVSTTVDTGVSVQVNDAPVAHIHKWGTGNVTKAASCSEEGSVTYTCSADGCDAANKQKTETLPKVAHKEVIDDAVAVTCTTDGKTAGKHCEECNTVIVAQETVPALGHDLTKTDAKAATCEEAGNNNYWTCGRCGKIYADEAGTEETTVEAQTLAALGHDYGTWIAEVPAGTSNGTKGHYHCDRCGKDFDTNKQELSDLTIPASYASVSTVEALKAAMNNNDLLGAELAANLEIPGGTLPAGKTLIVPADKTLTVTGNLYVHGTLDNRGTIKNEVLIDVFGDGKLDNSGTITGYKEKETDEVYTSTLAIEGGATLTNTGSINDCINVADYYKAGENQICKVTGVDNVIGSNFVKIAVVFDTTKVQTLLNDNSYEIVMPCGTDTTQDNIVALGSITVPAGKTLLLKKSVFDGTSTYQNSFTCANVNVEQSGAIVVRNGGSLTVTGTLTLATSSVEGAMNDSGCIQVQSGGSLTIGNVQYTGNGGVLTLNEGTSLVLSGLPKDVGDEKGSTGIFAILMGNAEVESGKTFTVPAAWDNLILVNGAVLTVRGTLTNNGHIENRGALYVYGTLTNSGELTCNNDFGNGSITVFGGTLSNTGAIRGDGQDTTLSVENGGTLDNVINNAPGTIKGMRISIVDYYPASGDPVISGWELFGDERDYTAPELDYFDLGAVAFGANAANTALNVTVGNNEGWYRYQYVIVCGTDAEPAVNTVELGGITVHEGGKLILCSWFDGTNTYLNNYILSENNTLTLNENARLECRNWSATPRTLTIDGTIVNNGGSYDFSGFTVDGKNAPVIVHSEAELTAALEKGGTIILEGTDEFVQNTDDGRMIVLAHPVTVSTDTELVNQFGNLLYIPGLTVNAGASLTVSNMTVVLAADSTVSGTLKIGGNCFVMLRTPNEAQTGEITELTVANGGKIVIGGEAESFRNAQLGNAEGKNAGKLINNGTIDVYGGLWFDSVGGTVNKCYSVEVHNESELVNALDKRYVTEIHIPESMTITGAPDSSDTSFGGCFYLNNNGRDGELNIYIHGVATLTVGDATHTTKLDIGEGVNVTLIQIKGSHAKVEVSKDSCVNVFGRLDVMGDNWRPEDYYIGNINFFPDVMEFGKRLLERVGAYNLPAMTDEELAENLKRANEWPDLSKENEDRGNGFKLLVKHGGLKPITEKDDQGKDYIVWRPFNKITYGVAIDVLTNVYKAIDTDATVLPALGDSGWTPDREHRMNDNEVEELLNKFVDVLPPINDSTTESFTVARDQEQIIYNTTFSKPITIICDKTKTNDDFGGDIKFDNCEFKQGVTVKMTAGVGYNVRLNNSCTGEFTVVDNTTQSVKGVENTNVTFFGMNGVTINGLKISGEIANVEDNDFNVNVRYDKEGNNSYISTVEIYNSTKNLVTVTGTYTGKLRVAGKLDISGVTMADNNSRIELSNQCDADINLGSNEIIVNDDCGGVYSFTGTGTVLVPNQNQHAYITVNDVYDVNSIQLGTPHIFGRNEFGIYFPLTSASGLTFTVVQGKYSEELQCVPDNAWTKLEGYTVDASNADKIQLVKNGKPWITDPYQVRVTVKVTGGCTVVYDTMMWKPVQMDEFIKELNTRLGKDYTLESLGISKTNGDLTFGICKTAFESIWADFKKTDPINMNQIIDDTGYWEELSRWTSSTDENKDDWNPDNWTRHWNDVDDMLNALTKMLSIEQE